MSDAVGGISTVPSALAVRLTCVECRSPGIPGFYRRGSRRQGLLAVIDRVAGRCYRCTRLHQWRCSGNRIKSKNDDKNISFAVASRASLESLSKWFRELVVVLVANQFGASTMARMYSATNSP